MRRRPRFLARVLTLAMLGGQILAGRAAEPGPARDAELQQQTREVNRLRQELERALSELKRLEQENRVLREQPPTVPARPAPLPKVEVNALPPLADEQLVEASELLAHYRSDPAAAARRYEAKRFRLRGKVEGFVTSAFQSSYEVRLQSPDPDLQLVCGFRYHGRFRSVFPRSQGKELVGRIDDRSVQLLFRVNDTVVIRGKCSGLKNGQVTMTSCERQR